MRRLLAVGALLVAAGCSRSGRWTHAEPDGRGNATAPLCALENVGELSERAQLEALEGRLQQFHGCLEASEAAPVVVATVSREGYVDWVTGPAGARLEAVEAKCVADVVRSLRFPRPSCERPARLAFRFRAEGPPEVLRGDGTCDGRGGLSPEELAETLAGYESDVRFCYERQLEQRPDLRGRVVARFVIDRGGRVAWVGLAEELEDPEVGRCIVGAMRTWEFPPPCGGIVSAAHPWILEPED